MKNKNSNYGVVKNLGKVREIEENFGSAEFPMCSLHHPHVSKITTQASLPSPQPRPLALPYPS